MGQSGIKVVYVAGPLTPTGRMANPAIEYLTNVRRMARVASELVRNGFSPYCPALDNQYWMTLNDGEFITESMIKRLSKDFLMRSDAVLLCEGWNTSKGTLKEIEIANDMDIPVFNSVESLLEGG